ncbi:hypothetical protein BKI52_38050 [marine bacterium AO1-C]|nr:hypothetical protein BKI52_38050 [marine bacterium AO1-C]
MLLKKNWFNSLWICLCGLVPLANAQVDKAYADVIIEAYYSHANPRYEYFYGGKGDIYPLIMRPSAVLGNNDQFVSLPKGSFITVGFTDNTIIDAPNQDDLFIEEVGRAGDQAAVWVSANGKDFTYLGRAKDDKVTSFDLADIGFKKPVVAVKILGLDTRGASPGFDLVSVRALRGSVGERPSPHLIPRHVKYNPPTPPTPSKVVEVRRVVEVVNNNTTTTVTTTKKSEKPRGAADNLRKALLNSRLRSKLHTLKKKKPAPKTQKITKITTNKKTEKKKKKKKIKEAGAESRQ